jgi:tRNA (mo5U34)-methyltransferase
MTNTEIRQRIAQFPRWHYQFDLAGELTPIFEPGHINRHQQRKAHFFQPLVSLCGGSLVGMRVLDLGCNAGYWALNSIWAGCSFVLGIDARPLHVEQADFVFEVNRIERDRYRFLQGDILSLSKRDLGAFDLVLCLGLLYHVNRPVDLLLLAESLNTDLLVIDTSLSLATDSSFRLVHEDIEEPRNAIHSGFVLWPTKKAVLDIVTSLGYDGVVLRPDFSNYTGAADYQSGERRAFLCTKSGRSLDRLAPLAEATFQGTQAW